MINLLFVIFLIWLAYIGIKKLTGSKFTGRVNEVESKEVFWTINDAIDELNATSPNPVSSSFSFVSEEWSLELRSVFERLTLNLKKKCPFPSVQFPDIEWGVGIKREDGDESLSYWSHEKTRQEWICGSSLEWICVGQWIGPSLRDLLRERQALMPAGALTFFVRLTSAPVPIAFVRKEPLGDGLFSHHANNLNKDTDEEKVKEGSGDKGKEGKSPRIKVLHTLAQNLKDLYLSGKDCDITLRVDHGTFKAHRAILTARVPLLSYRLSCKSAEAETGVLRVKGCNPQTFAVFLQFVYSGTADNLTSENVELVYDIADKYNLPDLKEECSLYIMSTLAISSVSSVIAFAVKRGEVLLLERATEFFLQHAEDIFPTIEWRMFLAENTTQANDLIIKAIRSRSPAGKRSSKTRYAISPKRNMTD